MQKIILTNPCQVSAEKLSPVNGGYWCSDCQKSVIDYSNMSDAEMLNYISKHGLGCGQFRDDQLERELIPTRAKKKLNIFYYLLILAAFLFKAPKSSAQCRPGHDTAQVKNPYMKMGGGQIQEVIIVTNGVEKRVEPKTTTRVFGTASITNNYKRYSLFWGLIKFKIRKKHA